MTKLTWRDAFMELENAVRDVHRTAQLAVTAIGNGNLAEFGLWQTHDKAVELNALYSQLHSTL